MTTAKQPQKDRSEKRERQQHDTGIGQQVLHSLGEPSDFLRVVVRHLWDDCYRVNILVGADLTAATIPHSYFLVTDSTGRIVTSTPKIAKQYDK